MWIAITMAGMPSCAAYVRRNGYSERVLNDSTAEDEREIWQARVDAGPGWTISDSEWNNFVERGARHARRWAYLIPLITILIPLITIVLTTFRATSNPLKRLSNSLESLGTYGIIIWIVMVPLNIIILLSIVQRKSRRHARAAALVRAEDGCVCPICDKPCAPRTPDGFAPRCRHGVSRDARDALIEFWQAHARRDIHANERLLANLPASDAPREMRVRFKNFFLRNRVVASDTERPFGVRFYSGLLASMASMKMVMMVILIFFVVEELNPQKSKWLFEVTSPNFIKLMMLIVFGTYIAGAFFSMSGAMRPTQQERCRACRQLLAGRVRPVRCTECGSDLNRSGATERILQTKQWKFIGVGLVIILLSVVGSSALRLGLGFSLLPTPILIAIAPYAERSIALSELQSRFLSPKERARISKMVIGIATPETGESLKGRRHLQSNFLLPGVATGDTPASTIDDALRAMVRLDGTVQRKLEGTTLVLTPSFGDDLFFYSGDVWVVFCGVSFDGAQPVSASTNPIDRLAVDPFGFIPGKEGRKRNENWIRAVETIKKDTSPQRYPTEFTAPCPKGARTARWKVTVLLLPFDEPPLIFFAADGTLKVPVNAIRTVELEGTIPLDE